MCPHLSTLRLQVAPSSTIFSITDGGLTRGDSEFMCPEMWALTPHEAARSKSARIFLNRIHK
jgi:hypothetical protein